jgi:hypothetical protein
MYLVVFYVGEYGWVCGCVGVWVGVCGWVCIQNRKVQNSLRSVGNCFASRSNFVLCCVRIVLVMELALLQPIIFSQTVFAYGT